MINKIFIWDDDILGRFRISQAVNLYNSENFKTDYVLDSNVILINSNPCIVINKVKYYAIYNIIDIDKNINTIFCFKI